MSTLLVRCSDAQANWLPSCKVEQLTASSLDHSIEEPTAAGLVSKPLCLMLQRCNSLRWRN